MSPTLLMSQCKAKTPTLPFPDPKQDPPPPQFGRSEVVSRTSPRAMGAGLLALRTPIFIHIYIYIYICVHVVLIGSLTKDVFRT